jgi:hypothetical protein
MKRARRDMESQRHRAAESSDDEEHFQKKEARRLARDTGAALFRPGSRLLT